MKILVTGGSGLAGTSIVNLLLQKGYEVISVDSAPPSGAIRRMPDMESGLTTVTLDTTDFGKVVAVTKGVDAIIHLAAIPNPIWRPEHEVFRINMISNWNVLEAAEIFGVPKVVMASSINAIGASFWEAQVREYMPLDEDTLSKAADAYAQSKLLGEIMAESFCRRRNLQIASLRYHGLWSRERQAEWNKGSKSDIYPAKKDDANNERMARNFWSWTDLDEAAEASILAFEKDWVGHEAFFIQADDTTVTTPTDDLLKMWYPDAERKSTISGFQSPISNGKAKRILDWNPTRTWRDA